MFSSVFAWFWPTPKSQTNETIKNNLEECCTGAENSFAFLPRRTFGEDKKWRAVHGELLLKVPDSYAKDTILRRVKQILDAVSGNSSITKKKFYVAELFEYLVGQHEFVHGHKKFELTAKRKMHEMHFNNDVLHRINCEQYSNILFNTSLEKTYDSSGEERDGEEKDEKTWCAVAKGEEKQQSRTRLSL